MTTGSMLLQKRILPYRGIDSIPSRHQTIMHLAIGSTSQYVNTSIPICQVHGNVTVSSHSVTVQLLLAIHQTIHPSIHPSTHPPTHSSIHPSIHPPILSMVITRPSALFGPANPSVHLCRSRVPGPAAPTHKILPTQAS